MQIELEARPSYGLAVVTLNKGEKITSESSAMVAMSQGLLAETGFNGAGSGGFVDWIKAALAGLARKFLAGETMFANTFTATQDGQQVMLAPSLIGDVEHIVLDGNRKVTVQATSYLASTPGVNVSLVWGGLSMLFGGEGAFFLECSGKGELLFNAYKYSGTDNAELALVWDAGGVTLRVVDAGRGMSPEEVARLGTPFASGREGGTGLGVVLARAVVEQHGGSVAFDSAPGQGTRVTLRLPDAA